MWEQALQRTREAQRQAFITAVRRLWEAGELYMIDVPKHLKNRDLICQPDPGQIREPHVVESYRWVWVPWLSNPNRCSVVSSYEVTAGM